MKLYLYTILSLVISLNYCSINTISQNQINSPNKKILVSFSLSKNNQPYYNIVYNNILILQNSQMGLIRSDVDFSTDLTLQSVSEIEEIRDQYNMLHGKKQSFSYLGNQRVFHLLHKSGEKMDIIFRVSNDGVAFRYYFPEESNEIKKIEKEVTTFHFLPNTTGWLQPMQEAKSGWNNVNPCYEEHYVQNVKLDLLEGSSPGWVFPALFRYQDVWMLLSETAPDRNYCGCRLQQNLGTTEFFIDFPQSPEIFPGGVLNPQSPLPWETPWRIIAIGNLKTIVESTLGTDLAKPSVIQDVSWIKPGRSSWSWVLLKDDSTIYDVQKRFIDYAADMGWEYCLIDADWDTKIGYDKIKELVEYAQRKNVGITLWYNSSGDWNNTTYHPKSQLLTHADRVKVFSRLKVMGVKSIKVDFFGGDGQSMMAYYQDILEDAADFNLLVNCHGSTIPRGWQRTYPNLVSMESVRGFEYITFDQFNDDLQPTHCCMLPFTRNVFDPMDFTPVCFSEVPNMVRRTTNCFELALAVLFHSGIQHYAEIPKGIKAVPIYVKTILKEVPVSWEETRFIDGFPGKLVIMARKTNDTWYIAGINGEETEKTISFTPAFLGDQKGILITDGKDNCSFERKEINFVAGEQITVNMKPYGGFVIKLGTK